MTDRLPSLPPISSVNPIPPVTSSHIDPHPPSSIGPADSAPSDHALYRSSSMNGPQMYYQSHLSGGQAPPPPPPQPVTPHYAPPPQQPPLAQPAPIQYGPAPPPGYGSHYGYANGLSSPAGPTSTMPPPMTSPLPLPPVSQPALPPTYSPGFDTTGQIPPPGMKPRVTATLWEDEGSLCFQVEARGICVARREGKF